MLDSMGSISLSRIDVTSSLFLWQAKVYDVSELCIHVSVWGQFNGSGASLFTISGSLNTEFVFWVALHLLQYIHLYEMNDNYHQVHIGKKLEWREVLLAHVLGELLQYAVDTDCPPF